MDSIDISVKQTGVLVTKAIHTLAKTQATHPGDILKKQLGDCIMASYKYFCHKANIKYDLDAAREAFNRYINAESFDFSSHDIFNSLYNLIASHTDYSNDKCQALWDEAFIQTLCMEDYGALRSYIDRNAQSELKNDNNICIDAFTRILPLHRYKDGGENVTLQNLFVRQDYAVISKAPDYDENHYEDTDNVIDYIYKFLDDKESKTLVIEGDAGSGKTSISSYLNYHYFKSQFTIDEKNRDYTIWNNRTLLTINLRDINKKVLSEDGLFEAIQEKAHAKHFEDFSENTVFILDGFDELCTINGYKDYEKELNKLNKQASTFKYIFLSRPGFISSYILKCSTILIKHFSKGKREKLLEKYEACNQEIEQDIKTYIESTTTNEEIFDTPFVLYLLISSKVNQDTLNNKYLLFDEIFCRQIVETEYHDANSAGFKTHAAGDDPAILDAIIRLTEEVAFFMHRNSTYSISKSDIETIASTNLNLEGDSTDMVSRSLALCTYLKYKESDGFIEFYHNQIKDFYLFKKIIREINTIYFDRFVYFISSLDMLQANGKNPGEIMAAKCCELFQYDFESPFWEFCVDSMKTINRNEFKFLWIEMENNISTLPSTTAFLFYDSNKFLKKILDDMEKEKKSYAGKDITTSLCNTIINTILFYYCCLNSCNQDIVIRVCDPTSLFYEKEISRNVQAKFFQSFNSIRNIAKTKIPLDITSADLTLTNLKDSHLENFHLQWADLRFAHLEGAHLENALLKDSHLECAYLKDSYLNEAHLERAVIATAYDAQLAHWDGAYLEDAYVTRSQAEFFESSGAIFNVLNIVDDDNPTKVIYKYVRNIIDPPH